MGCTAGRFNCCIDNDQNLQDPLLAKGDIVENIKKDRHIYFFQRKYQQVLLPLRLKKKIKSVNQIDLATTDKQQHQRYAQTVNNAIKNNSVSATNVLTFMITQIADLRDRAELKANIDPTEKEAALKCFVYLYTGQYAYKKINSMLRRREYEKIASVIAVVKQELAVYKKHFTRTLKANNTNGRFLDLYRGVKKPDVTMKNGSKLYWRSFVSTSLNRQVAQRFGVNLYTIQLDTRNPHEYFIVPKELSQYQEEEIIIFPYLHIQCTRSQGYGSKSAYWVKQIKADQN